MPPVRLATEPYVGTQISALVNAAPAGGDTLGELHARLAVVEALGSLATDAELVAAVAALIGSADTAGDTLGELQSLIGLRLLKSANLSDLANAGTARTNLGLGNVDNTADSAKPVSTAQQTALDLKANAANPTFTGTVTIPDGALAIADTSGLQAALDAKAADSAVVKLTGDQSVAGVKTFTGRTAHSAGVVITDDDGTTTVNGYRSLLALTPPTTDEEVVGLVFKVPDATFGVGQDYAEGNSVVWLSDADGTVTSPSPTIKVISATTNATPVAVTTSTTHGFSTGDVVRITGTGIGALDGKWWKVTVTSTTAFTLDGSTAPGSTAAVGSAFTDRSAVLARWSPEGGLGLGGGIHIPVGLRGRSGAVLPTYGIHIDIAGDITGLTINNASATYLATTPTANYVQVLDARASNAVRFSVNAAGQTTHDFGTTALPGITFSGDTDTGIYRDAAGVIGVSVDGVEIVDIAANGIITNPGQTYQVHVGAWFGLSALAFGTTDDTAVYRVGAGVVGLGSALSISAATNGTAYLEFKEQSSEPAAPAADFVRLFAQDNGSGKSRLVAKFNSGANVVLATQA